MASMKDTNEYRGKASEDKRMFMDDLYEYDFASSATLSDIGSLLRALEAVRKLLSDPVRMVDLGCGYGGLTSIVKKYLSIPEAYCVDTDEERLSIAKERGLRIVKADIEDGIPLPSESFDLVTSFGVIEHLKWYDSLVSEAYRLLKAGGVFVLSMPNLGSYINRVALLLGYQPRDVEISTKRAYGVFPLYPRGPIGHARSATLRAVKELLQDYGFEVVKAFPLNPKIVKPRMLRVVIGFLDGSIGRIPALARRFIVIGVKR